MKLPISPWVGPAILALVLAVLGWRLGRLRQLARSGRAHLQPLASVGTWRAYGDAIVGTTVGLLLWHLLFSRHAPRLAELSYYLVALALVSPVGRRWQDRLRAWLARP